MVSGPLWTGPLHSAEFIEDMLTLAQQWEWIGNGLGKDLEKLLRQMVDESDSKLPVGYVKMDEVTKFYYFFSWSSIAFLFLDQ